MEPDQSRCVEPSGGYHVLRRSYCSGSVPFSQVGAGIVKNLEEAKNRVKVETTVWEPSPQKEIYEELFAQYAELPPLL